MDTLALGVASRLDHLRARLLRFFLQSRLLRDLFRSRPRRLFVLFVLFECVALALTAVIPLWQLLLGPLLFGFAHLVSSLRYFHVGLSAPRQVADRALQGRAFRTLAVASGLYTLWRIARSRTLSGDVAARLSEFEGAWLLDGAFVLFVLIAGARLYGKRPGRIGLGLLVAAPLLWGFATAPRLTIGVLALAHNFVGFLYWIALATRPRERQVAVAALVVFTAISAALFAGVLTPVTTAFGSWADPGVGGVSARSIGRLVAPGLGSDWWMPATAAFAFGQSTHYFVWLKAIPDQAHTAEVPASFQHGLRLLRADFGAVATRIILGVAVGGGLVWLFIGFETARVLYFALAGFHGYLELAGLGLLHARRSAVVASPNPASRRPA